MIPVQWLIDFLQYVQNQGGVAQIGYVVAIVAAVSLVTAWVMRAFRRGYHVIEDENEKLTAQVESTQETLKTVRRENEDLQSGIDSLQACFPDAVLSLVKQEIRDGNHQIATRELQGMFDDISPGLAACFLRLSELASVPSDDETGVDAVGDAARYRRLAALLQAAEEKASTP